jgi:hypothetical protein
VRKALWEAVSFGSKKSEEVVGGLKKTASAVADPRHKRKRRIKFIVT